MRCLATLALLAIAITGCSPDSDSDYPREPAGPPDLTVRQSPNDTIRLGETVTFTAVFRDSLNPKWLYDWTLNRQENARRSWWLRMCATPRRRSCSRCRRTAGSA